MELLHPAPAFHQLPHLRVLASRRSARHGGAPSRMATASTAAADATRSSSVRASCSAAHPSVLDLTERVVVRQAIEEVCRHRAWSLCAAHVRTNHVHVVLAANAPAGRVMGDLKA